MTGEQSMETRVADLQRAVEVGFATMKGDMAVFAERDRMAESLHTQQNAESEKLRDRVDGLGRKIAWAYGAAAGFSAASGFIAWALSRH